MPKAGKDHEGTSVQGSTRLQLSASFASVHCLKCLLSGLTNSTIWFEGRLAKVDSSDGISSSLGKGSHMGSSTNKRVYEAGQASVER